MPKVKLEFRQLHRRNKELFHAKELIKRLKEIEKAPNRRGKLERAALVGGRVIAERAFEHAPKDTRKAANTIRARLESSARGIAHVTIGPSSRGYYLMYHEFGTRKLHQNSFLEKALDEMQKASLQAMADEYRRLLEWQRRRNL